MAAIPASQVNAPGPNFPAPPEGDRPGLASAPGANARTGASVLKDGYRQTGQAETDPEQEQPPASKRLCFSNGRGNDGTAGSAADILSQPEQPSDVVMRHASSPPTAVRGQEFASKPTMAPSSPDKCGQPSDLEASAAGASKPANAGAEIAEPRDHGSHAQQSGALLHRGNNHQDERDQSAAATSVGQEAGAGSGLDVGADADVVR